MCDNLHKCLQVNITDALPFRKAFVWHGRPLESQPRQFRENPRSRCERAVLQQASTFLSEKGLV